MTIELQPHQQNALIQLSNGKILWGGVGSGKSQVAVAYYLAHETPKDIYVITTAKKRDKMEWDTEFVHHVVSRHPDSTLHGVLHVDSWNNIDKYSDVVGGFFIFDEQRLVGSGKWVKAFLKIVKNNNWILLSATPGDTWMDYIPVFIANGFYKNRTQFKREHVVYKPYSKFPKVERYLGTGRLIKYRNRILVHMPYPRLTTRHSMTRYVSHNEDLLRSIIKNRWNIYKNQPVRDITELWHLLRRIINSDPSRVREIRELLSLHKRIIVFYNFNYELEALRALQDVTAVSEWNGRRHEEIPKTDSWIYLVQYVAGAEGWNCIETDTICFYSLTYSYKHWENAHGRIDRLNTPFIDLYYYILRSKSVVDAAIWHSLRAKENFNVHKIPIEQLK
jgi:hypothetical protein